MSATWKLLRSRGDWDEHKALLACSFPAGERLEWGGGPTAYPCLAATVPMPGSCMKTAFVYTADAQALMQAAAVGAPAARGSGPPEPAVPGPTAAERDLAVNAHLYSIIQAMEASGLIAPEAYLRLFVRNLANQDGWTAEDHARLLAGHVAPAEPGAFSDDEAQ